MNNDFYRDVVKEYAYWTVSVHHNQGYLGRCIIWCKRTDALDLADATPEEQAELFTIIKELRLAAHELFKPDWFNYSFLGNENRHLHAHFVPRYADHRVFQDMIFEDKLYGHNYQTDPTFIAPGHVREGIQQAYQRVLG